MINSLNENIMDAILTSKAPKQVKKNVKKKTPSRTKEGVPTPKSAFIDRKLTQF